MYYFTAKSLIELIKSFNFKPLFLLQIS